MDISTFASIPIIMFICYYFSIVLKCYKKEDNFISIVCGGSGGLLGIISYYIAPEVIHSDNVLATTATGIASGLASQTIKRWKTSLFLFVKKI